MPRSLLVKIGLFAGLGTGIVCLAYGLACTFALSLVCDALIGKFVFRGQPPMPPAEGDER